ncbi:MAG: cyclic nucleotide-binding domain-containing protein [Peptostreptococcaceae bacterium]|nr:cyclic nucleotide-binding domain-containing protein [Peptostreptococcaceae bacterium]
MENLNNILKKSILFENISEEEINDIVKISKSEDISIRKDEYLFYQEENSKYLFILLDGIVQIERVDANGKRMIMNRFDEIGTMFAEVYIYFSDKIYDYSCVAIKNARVFAIPKEFLLKLLI